MIDLDLMFGSVDVCLDIGHGPHALACHPELRTARPDLAQAIDSAPCSGLYVLPHPETSRKSPPSIPETLRRFFGLLRAAYETVVIDTSKGLQSSDFTAFEMSDVILVVVQLDVACLRNTSRLIASSASSTGLPTASSWS